MNIWITTLDIMTHSYATVGRLPLDILMKTHRCTDERRYGNDDHIDEIRTVTSSLVLHNHRERSIVTGTVTEGTYNELIAQSKRKSTNKVQYSNTPKLDGVYILSDAYTTTPCIHFVGINCKYLTTYTCTQYISIGECPSIAPFLENNGPRPRKGPRSIVFKEWNDTRTFAYIKSTHRLQPLPLYM